MAKNDSTTNDRAAVERRLDERLGEQFPLNCVPFSVWYDTNIETDDPKWAVNDEKGDAIVVAHNHVTAVKIADALRNSAKQGQVRRTAEKPFFSCNSKQDALFAVREGITLDDALCEASCLLSAAKDVMYAIASKDDAPEIWAAAYLVDMSKAVVDAADTSEHIDAMEASHA